MHNFLISCLISDCSLSISDTRWMSKREESVSLDKCSGSILIVASKLVSTMAGQLRRFLTCGVLINPHSKGYSTWSVCVCLLVRIYHLEQLRVSFLYICFVK